jgi:hypothetical protein
MRILACFETIDEELACNNALFSLQNAWNPRKIRVFSTGDLI